MTKHTQGHGCCSGDRAAHAGQDVDEAAVAARELSGAERALVGDLVRQARAEGSH